MPLVLPAIARSVFKAVSVLPLLGSLAFAQSVIATIPATDGTQGNPMTIAVNPLTSRVYIAGSNVEVVDQKTNQVIDNIAVGSGQLQGIAVDPVLNRAFVVDYADGVFAIDLNTNTIVGNYTNLAPNGVAVNPVTHRVYVESFDYTNEAAALYVFDAATLNLITTIDDNGQGQPFGDPQCVVVVNPVTNMIYVPINLYTPNLWVVDGNTNTNVATIGGLAPISYGADVDPVRNLIFVGGWLNDLSEVNGETNTQITMVSNLDTQPDGISVDPLHGKVYIVSQQDDLVQIFDEKSQTIEATTIPVSGAPVNSTIDYIHGLLYVGNTGETYQNNPPPPSVSVIKLQ